MEFLMTEKKFNIRKQLFNWHMWAGIIFAIPVVLVSLTAIFIAHEKGLGTKKILVNAGWLPGYQTSEEDLAHYLDDVKAFAQADGKQYYGTKVGVLEQSPAGLRVLPGTEGKEVRDLEISGFSIFVASKYGVYQVMEGATDELIKGDFHGIQIEDGQLIASQGKYGVMTSTDGGKNWDQQGKLSQILPPTALASISSQLELSGQMEAVAMEKLILDIHTGKAFFGENAMWVWIDLIGLSLLLMTVTGIWMWYKRKYGKQVKPSSGSQVRVAKPRPIMKPVMKPVLNTDSIKA
jgi:hypothetical protein